MKVGDKIYAVTEYVSLAEKPTTSSVILLDFTIVEMSENSVFLIGRTVHAGTIEWSNPAAERSLTPAAAVGYYVSQIDKEIAQKQSRLEEAAALGECCVNDMQSHLEELRLFRADALALCAEEASAIGT